MTKFYAPKSAQRYFGTDKVSKATVGGSSCGTGDDGDKPQASCGSSCGAGDDK